VPVGFAVEGLRPDLVRCYRGPVERTIRCEVRFETLRERPLPFGECRVWTVRLSPRLRLHIKILQFQRLNRVGIKLVGLQLIQLLPPDLRQVPCESGFWYGEGPRLSQEESHEGARPSGPSRLARP
jgi:hypothetical protein